MGRTRPIAALAILAMLASLLVAGVAAAPAGATTTNQVVSPGQPNGWASGLETGTNGSQTFVAGPSGATNAGSARFQLGDATSGVLMATAAPAGTLLSDISGLSYRTYRASADGGNNLAVTLQLGMDYDSTDGNDAFQGRLVFEPYQGGNSGTIVQNTWQTWNPLTNGVWWMSKKAIVGGSLETSIFCPQSSPCSWSTITGHFPNARIATAASNLGFLGFKAGSAWAGFDGNVDDLSYTIAGNTTNVDFEPNCTSTCYVDAAAGNDNNSGTGPGAGVAMATIGAALTRVDTGGTIVLASGDYTEQLTIGKDVTITGAGSATTNIVGPANLNDSMCVSPTGGQPWRPIVSVCNQTGTSTVTITGVTVKGGASGMDGDNSCNPLLYGILVTDGETLDISNSAVVDTYNANTSDWGCQSGVGIRAGINANGEVGHLNADYVAVSRYQKNGVVVDGPGSTGTLDHMTVQGDQLAGLSSNIAMNGVQISRGATGSLTNSTVSGNQCDHPSCGSDPFNDTQSAGVLLWDLGPGGPTDNVTVSSSSITGNDMGIYTSLGSGSATVSANTVTTNRYVGVLEDEGAADITANTITSNGSYGVLAVQGWSGGADVSGTVSQNVISGQPIAVSTNDVGADAFGVTITVNRNSISAGTTKVENNTAVGPLDAECNWYGAPGTPTGFAGNVDFTPWLLSSDLNGSCTVPSIAFTSATLTKVEGNSGTSNASLTLQLSNAVGANVTVQYATTNGTAAAPGDYTATSGTATITAGNTSTTVNVPVKGDTTVEANETFTVTISSPANATLGATTIATVTITNDDAPVISAPAAAIDVLEGNSGTTNVAMDITMDRPSIDPVTVTWTTADGTAKLGNADYVTGTGTLTYAPGETTKTITLVVKGDLHLEDYEYFKVNLSNPTGGSPAPTIGTGGKVQILNDEKPTVTFRNIQVGEGKVAVLKPTLGKRYFQPITLSYTTVNGSALAGSDYTAVAGSSTFAAGTKGAIVVSVPTAYDFTTETDETFNVAVSSPSIKVSPVTRKVTILANAT